MKKFIFLIILVLFGNIKIQAQDNFSGYWANEDTTQIIKIYKENSFYYGEIIFRKDRALKEIKNKIVLVKMKKKRNLYGGTYFDYDLNKEYEVKFELKDAKTLYFNGFYEIFNINKVWHKVP